MDFYLDIFSTQSKIFYVLRTVVNHVFSSEVSRFLRRGRDVEMKASGSSVTMTKVGVGN